MFHKYHVKLFQHVGLLLAKCWHNDVSGVCPRLNTQIQIMFHFLSKQIARIMMAMILHTLSFV